MVRSEHQSIPDPVTGSVDFALREVYNSEQLFGGGSGTAKQLSPVQSTANSWITVGIAMRFLSQTYPPLSPQGYGFEFHNVPFGGKADVVPTYRDVRF